MPAVLLIITFFFNKVYVNKVYNIKTIKRLHKTSASLQSLNRFKTLNTIITGFYRFVSRFRLQHKNFTNAFRSSTGGAGTLPDR